MQWKELSVGILKADIIQYEKITFIIIIIYYFILRVNGQACLSVEQNSLSLTTCILQKIHK